MNFTKSFIPAALALMTVALPSCKDDGYWDGASVSPDAVTADEQVSYSATFLPGDEIPDPTFELTLSRGTTEGSATIALAAAMADAAGKYTLPVDPGVWSVPASVTFAPGQNSVTIPVTLKATEIGSYKLRVSVADPSFVALGGNSSWTVSATIQGSTPDPVWESMGKGKYTNGYFFDYVYEVEVEKDVAQYSEDQLGYYGHYRLVAPMTEGFQSEGYYEAGYMEGNPPAYIQFYIVAPGQTIPNTDITVPDGDQYYCYIPQYDTGFHNPNYEGTVLALGPQNLTNTTIADCAGQAVLGWKTAPTASNPQGEIGAVGLGCYLYIVSAGGGWNYLRDSKTMNFVFPGYSLGDYSFTLAYGGHLIDAEKQEFLISDVEITGKDVAYVYTGVVKTAVAADALAAVQAAVDALGSDEPASTDLPEVTKLTASGSAKFQVEESGSYTIAAISYDADGSAQESQTVTVKFTSINDMGGDTNWKTLGVGEYHDDILTVAYELDPDYLTYEVEVQQNVNEPGRYRIVNPYGKGIYPYNIGDLTTLDEYMEFDATNPQMVLIPAYALGNITNLGTCTVYSMSYYQKALGATDEDIIAAGYGGTLDLGIITFPARCILAEFSALGKIYYTNSDGLTELIIPDEGSYTVKKAHKALKSKPHTAVRHKTLGKKAAANADLMKRFGLKSVAKAPRKCDFGATATSFRVPMAL